MSQITPPVTTPPAAPAVPTRHAVVEGPQWGAIALGAARAEEREEAKTRPT